MRALVIDDETLVLEGLEALLLAATVLDQLDQAH